MKVLAVFAVVLLVQASLVKSQKTHQCNGHEIKMSEAKIAAAKKCGEAAGIKSMEELTPDKIPCFAKCMMETTNLVDAEGKPHKENILKCIDEAVPGDLKDAYKGAMEKCLNEHGGKINPKDATCASYGPLAMCAMTAMKSICKG